MILFKSKLSSCPSILIFKNIFRISFLLSHAFIKVDSRQCFNPDGSLSDNYVCEPSKDQSFCCGEDWTCLENRVCVLSTQSGGNGRSARGTCTDRTWKSAECPQFCIANSNMNQCDKHSYCCGGTDCDCNSGVNTITFDSYPLPISDSGFPTFRAQNLSSTTTSIPVETSTASEQELSVTASDMTGFPTSQAQNLSSTTTSIPVETNTASEQELSVTASDMTGTSTTKSQKNSEISFSSSLRNLSTSNISKNKSTVLSSSTTSSSATPPPSLLPSSSSSSQEKSQDTIKISIGVCVVIAMLLIGLIVAFSIWRERRLKKHMRELRSRWVPTDYLSKTASANVPDSSARLTRNILDETCNTTPYHSFSDSIRQPETVERRSAPQELRISVATETWPAFHRPQNPDYDIGLIEAKSQTMKIHEQH